MLDAIPNISSSTNKLVGRVSNSVLPSVDCFLAFFQISMKVPDLLNTEQFGPEQHNGCRIDGCNNGSNHRRVFSVKTTRRSFKRSFRKLSATLSAPQQTPDDPASPVATTTPKRNSSFRQSRKKKHPAEQWPPNVDPIFSESNPESDAVSNF